MDPHTDDSTKAGPQDTTSPIHPGRRVVMRAGVAVPVGVGLATLAACGSEESGGSAEPAGGDTSGGDTSGSDTSDQTGESGGADASPDGFPTADVPVGGATYDEASETVYTQPTDGDFRAFDSTCPHQQCAVSGFADGELLCPCHGSKFNLDTGAVTGGPAPSGLTAREVTVSGADLVLG